MSLVGKRIHKKSAPRVNTLNLLQSDGFHTAYFIMRPDQFYPLAFRLAVVRQLTVVVRMSEEKGTHSIKRIRPTCIEHVNSRGPGQVPG